jgi:hypothetical protein
MTVSVFRLIVIVVRAICLGSKAVRLALFDHGWASHSESCKLITKLRLGQEEAFFFLDLKFELRGELRAWWVESLSDLDPHTLPDTHHSTRGTTFNYYHDTQ